MHVSYCQLFSREIKECFTSLSDNPDCRVIVLTGAGKHFTAGLDLNSAMEMGRELGAIDDVGRRGHFIEKRIKECQVSVDVELKSTKIERLGEKMEIFVKFQSVLAPEQ